MQGIIILCFMINIITEKAEKRATQITTAMAATATETFYQQFSALPLFLSRHLQ